MALNDAKLNCWTFAGWEPDRHYRRMGSLPSIAFGNGHWVGGQWRNRVISRDTVSMLVDCGIDIVFPYFYKGFGIKTDSADWPQLKEFVALCHEQDVKVCGYLQGRSIYYETFLEEVPQVMDWVALRHDRSPDRYAYYRLAPCLTCEDYLAYVRKIIHIGLTEIGLDAIHNDNSFYKHCYCDRCVGLFREWLNAMPDLERRTGLPNANHVLPPALPDQAWDIVDPLQIAWIEFGLQKRLEAYRGFYETVKEVKPDAFYSTNPGFPRGGGFKFRFFIDPAREGTICDAACCENNRLPRVEDETIFSQQEAYLYADAGGYNIMHTSWIHHPEQGLVPHRTVGECWTGLSEEFSHHAAMLGNNWLLRPTGDGERILGDTDHLRIGHAQGVHFFKDLYERLQLTGRRQWSQIALLIDTDTLNHSSSDLSAVRALLGWSLIQNVPLVMVYAGQPIPDFVRAVFVCQQTAISDARLDEITQLARQDNLTVFLAGTTGYRDEWMVYRNKSDWLEWRQSEGLITDSGEQLQWDKTPQAHATSELVWPNEACFRDMQIFVDMPEWPKGFGAETPENVLVNTEITPDGRLLIHIRDQAGTEQQIHGCSILLDAKLSAKRTVTMYTPNHEPTQLSSDSEGPIKLKLPTFQYYALLVVE